MRGAREVVAKALALECMRAAKAQERGCYVFAFAGPQEVGAGAAVCGQEQRRRQPLALRRLWRQAGDHVGCGGMGLPLCPTS